MNSAKTPLPIDSMETDEENSSKTPLPIDSTMADEEVRLNVGGLLFVTRKSTLNKHPGTTLSLLTPESQYYNSQSREYRFDRDPAIFSHILNFYRWGELHVPNNVCAMGYRKELSFWNIKHEYVAPCCWKQFYQIESDLETLDKLKQSTAAIYQSPSVPWIKEKIDGRLSSRMKLWLFLDEPNYSTAAKIWHNIYLGFVVLSTAVYTLWMLPVLRVAPYIVTNDIHGNHTNDKIHDLVETDAHPVLFALDNLCMMVFIVELVLHFVVCPDKLQFLRCWYNRLNFLLVLTMVSSFALEIRKDWIQTEFLGVVYYILKNFNAFRLLLLFRLEKQYVGLKILLLSLHQSAAELLLLSVTLLIAVMIYAGLMFCAEIDEKTFPTIFTAMWWAIITMTTVGYGDYTPIDAPGYVIGSMCAITGILIIALPIAVVASNFAEYYSCKDYQERHIKASKQENKDLPLKESSKIFH